VVGASCFVFTAEITVSRDHQNLNRAPGHSRFVEPNSCDQVVDGLVVSTQSTTSSNDVRARRSGAGGKPAKSRCQGCTTGPLTCRRPVEIDSARGGEGRSNALVVSRALSGPTSDSSRPYYGPKCPSSANQVAPSRPAGGSGSRQRGTGVVMVQGGQAGEQKLAARGTASRPACTLHLRPWIVSHSVYPAASPRPEVTCHPCLSSRGTR